MKLRTLVSFLLTLSLFYSCKNRSAMPDTSTHVIRLKPGADLKRSIQEYVDRNGLEAAWVVTCSGSLTDYAIRFANQPQIDTGKGHFEIVILSGTLSKNGSHLHISISDSTGRTIGGHLGDGSIVYTTAEIVLQSSDQFIFTREEDGSTPWKELQIKKKPDNPDK